MAETRVWPCHRCITVVRMRRWTSDRLNAALGIATVVCHAWQATRVPKADMAGHLMALLLLSWVVIRSKGCSAISAKPRNYRRIWSCSSLRQNCRDVFLTSNAKHRIVIHNMIKGERGETVEWSEGNAKMGRKLWKLWKRSGCISRYSGSYALCCAVKRASMSAPSTRWTSDRNLQKPSRG